MSSTPNAGSDGFNDKPMRVAGVDAAGDGWAMAITSVEHASPVEFSVWPSLDSLWAHAQSNGVLVVGVDMPMGLPGPDRRTADIEAREILGPRRSSISWSPPLCTLDSADHPEANRLSRELTGRGLSTQGFALMPKIREVRQALGTASFQRWARPRAVGGSHEIWTLGGQRLVIPRHREINERTAEGILADARRITGQ